MVELMDLWLPIVLSAVIVFVASSIIWMATPLHKHDYKDPGDKEGAILDTVRGAGLTPGVYFVPWCAPKNAKDPAHIAKMDAGPWAMMTVLPGKPNMGRMLGLWFIHAVVIAVCVAYLASHAGLAAGAEYLSVFRIVGTTTLLAYAGFALPMYIWHGLPGRRAAGMVVDGLVYALLTAGTFAWLWPSAAAIG